MASTSCEFEMGVTTEAKCIQCHVTREVDDASMTLQESSSDEHEVKVSCVVVTPTACECGENRVRVRVKLDFG